MRKSKHDILTAVRAAAGAEGTESIGRLRFTAITGLKEAAWKYYWARWNDVLADAGLEAGIKTERSTDDEVVLSLVPLIRKLNKWPTSAEIRIFARENPGFPADSTIRLRGGTPLLAQKLLSLCEVNDDLSDVANICRPLISSENPSDGIWVSTEPIQGYVYLMKSGSYHKIGKSKSPDRRRSEVAVLRPHDVETVHVIPTDDPSGIEAYWHNRFKDKRHRGEFYRLDAADVRAFKQRRDFM